MRLSLIYYSTALLQFSKFGWTSSRFTPLIALKCSRWHIVQRRIWNLAQNSS
ncbi:hypothetical protein ZOSMA_145G00140 [Zostera marina]|uniref:Uncharacterized protein n=1 Tax=Zostera marina TaxID=29655 RepID=A0A0K9PXI9_ZOSMR|nr:hypothetical protein ZOSMA_145G00140 [Zostera marina]